MAYSQFTQNPENEALGNEKRFNVGEHLTENYDIYVRMIQGIICMFNLSATSQVEREDLVQEALLCLWEKQDRYNPEIGPYENWASTVVYNRIMDIIRHDVYKKDTENRLKDVYDMADILPFDVTAEREMLEPEVRNDFEKALRLALKNEKSPTVQMGLTGVCAIFTGTYDREALAASYGITPDHFSACVSRARKKIQEYMDGYCA